MSNLCSICLEDINVDMNIDLSVTKCNHTFHTSCLLKCKNKKCPICRQIMTNDEDVIQNTSGPISDRAISDWANNVWNYDSLRTMYSSHVMLFDVNIPQRPYREEFNELRRILHDQNLSIYRNINENQNKKIYKHRCEIIFLGFMFWLMSYVSKT